MLKLIYSALLGFMLALGLMHTTVMAQEKEKNYSDFILKDVNFQEYSLKQYADKQAIVLIFTSSHCSWATKYEARLTKLHKAFADKKVAFIAINSNDSSISRRDARLAMKENSSFPFPYLKDKDQVVAHMFEATRTPEALVLKPTEEGFRLVYRGKIDDNPIAEESVKTPYLANAIQATLDGKTPEIQQTELSGCNIKWLR